jgi:hypothetical protein
MAREFYPNTVGFPIRITLEDLTDSEILEIQSLVFTVRRPIGSTFTRNLGPGDIIDNYVQYITQEGDFPAGGLHTFELVLAMTGGRSLPLLGSFNINATYISTADTHASRMLALIESAMEGRIPAGLEMTIINGQNITRMSLNTLSMLRDKYRAEVMAERNAARISSGYPSRKNVFARFRPVGGSW